MIETYEIAKLELKVDDILVIKYKVPPSSVKEYSNLIHDMYDIVPKGVRVICINGKTIELSVIHPEVKT